MKRTLFYVRSLSICTVLIFCVTTVLPLRPACADEVRAATLAAAQQPGFGAITSLAAGKRDRLVAALRFLEQIAREQERKENPAVAQEESLANKSNEYATEVSRMRIGVMTRILLMVLKHPKTVVLLAIACLFPHKNFSQTTTRPDAGSRDKGLYGTAATNDTKIARDAYHLIPEIANNDRLPHDGATGPDPRIRAAVEAFIDSLKHGDLLGGFSVPDTIPEALRQAPGKMHVVPLLAANKTVAGYVYLMFDTEGYSFALEDGYGQVVRQDEPNALGDRVVRLVPKGNDFDPRNPAYRFNATSVRVSEDAGQTSPKQSEKTFDKTTDGKTLYRQWARSVNKQSQQTTREKTPDTTIGLRDFLRQFLQTPLAGEETDTVARDSLIAKTVATIVNGKGWIANRNDTVLTKQLGGLMRDLFNDPAGVQDSLLYFLPPTPAGTRQCVKIMVTRTDGPAGEAAFSTEVIPLVSRKTTADILDERNKTVRDFLKAIALDDPAHGMLNGFVIDQNELLALKGNPTGEYRLALRDPATRTIGGYLYVAFVNDGVVYALEDNAGRVLKRSAIDAGTVTLEKVKRDNTFSPLREAFQCDGDMLPVLIRDFLDTPNEQFGRIAAAYASIDTIIADVIGEMYRDPQLTPFIQNEKHFRLRMKSLMYTLFKTEEPSAEMTVSLPEDSKEIYWGRWIIVTCTRSARGIAYSYKAVPLFGAREGYFADRPFPYGTKYTPAYDQDAIASQLRSVSPDDLGGFHFEKNADYRALTEQVPAHIRKEKVYKLVLLRPDSTIGGTIELQYHTEKRETKVRMTLRNHAGQTLRIKNQGKSDEQVRFSGSPNTPFGRPEEGTWLPAFFSLDEIEGVVTGYLNTPDDQQHKETEMNALLQNLHGYDLMVKMGDGTMVPGITAFLDPDAGRQVFLLVDPSGREDKDRSIEIDFIHRYFILKEGGRTWSRRCIPPERKRKASPRFCDTDGTYQFNGSSMMAPGTERIPLDEMGDVFTQAFGFNTPLGSEETAITNKRIMDLARRNMMPLPMLHREQTDSIRTRAVRDSIFVDIPAGYNFPETPAYTASNAYRYGDVVLPQKDRSIVVIFDWSGSINTAAEVSSAKKALRSFLSSLPTGTRVRMTGVDSTNPGTTLTELIVSPASIDAYLKKLGDKGSGVSLLGQTLYNVLQQVDPSSPIVYFTDGYPQSRPGESGEDNFKSYADAATKLLGERHQQIYFLVVGKKYHQFEDIHYALKEAGSPTWYIPMDNFSELEKNFVAIAQNLEQVRIVPHRGERGLHVRITSANGDTLWQQEMATKRWLDNVYRNAPVWKNTVNGPVGYNPAENELDLKRITIDDPVSGKPYAMTDERVHPYFSTIAYAEKKAPVTVLPKYDGQKYLFVFDVSNSMQKTDRKGNILVYDKGHARAGEPVCDHLTPLKPKMEALIHTLQDQHNETGSRIVGMAKYSDECTMLWNDNEAAQEAFVEGLRGERTTKGFKALLKVLKAVVDDGYDVNHIVWIADGCFQDVQNMTPELQEYLLRYADPDENGNPRRKISTIGFAEFTDMFNQLQAMSPEELAEPESDREIMSIKRMYLISRMTGGEIIAGKDLELLFDRFMEDQAVTEPLPVDETIITGITIYGELVLPGEKAGRPFKTVIPVHDPINTLKEAAALPPEEFLRVCRNVLGVQSNEQMAERIVDLAYAGSPLALEVTNAVWNDPAFQNEYMPFLKIFSVKVIPVDQRNIRYEYGDDTSNMVLSVGSKYDEAPDDWMVKTVGYEERRRFTFNPSDPAQLRALFLVLLDLKTAQVDDVQRQEYKEWVFHMRDDFMKHLYQVVTETSVLKSA